MLMARLRGSAPILATILAVVAFVSAFAVATVVFLDERSSSSLTTELSVRSGSHLALRASFDRATDGDQQDADVRAAIERTFADVAVPLTVYRGVETEAYYRFVAGDGIELAGPGTAATFPDLAEHATFLTGSAPADGFEVAVQADAAAQLGLQVGDELSLNEQPFTVTGTWRALDPLDPRWFGDLGVATGQIEQRLGPFAVDEAAWSRFTSPPVATWTIVPTSIESITASNSVSLRRAWAGAQREWRGTVPEFESMAVEQPLSRTLDEFALRYAGLRAVEPVVFVLMAGTALVGLSQIVQLLVTTRERESALFWARGQSPAAVAGRLTAEVGVSALLGALVGAGAVATGVIALGMGSSLAGLRTVAFVIPATVVVGATALTAIAAGRSARAIATPARGGRAARAVRVAIPGVVALVTIAAALAVWQLQLYGSPLVTSATGSTIVDPVAVAAPAAALIAVVLMGLTAFPWIAGRHARRADAGGVRAHLAARTLVKGARRVVAPLVVVALAVGSVTIAASFSATWSTSFTQAAQLYAGADVRVSSRFAPISPQQLDAVTAVDGVDAIAPVDAQTLSVGTVRGTTLAAAPDALRELSTTADGTFDPIVAAEVIATDAPGPTISADATELSLRVEVRRFDEPPGITAWITDRMGRLFTVPFGQPTPDGGDDVVYVAHPGGITGTLVSFDLDLHGQDPDALPSFQLVELVQTTSAGDQVLGLDQFWVLDTLRDQQYPPASFADGSGFALDSALPSLRMTAALDGTANDQLRPPLLVSQSLADSLQLTIGDIVVFTIREADRRLNGIVASIVPTIPGSRTGDTVLLDLVYSNHLRLRTEAVPSSMSDLWIATGAPETVRDGIRELLPANTRIDTSTDPVGRAVLGAAPIALWAAALCCVAIAIAAVASAARSRLRWGREEFGTLRAIGLGTRDQSAVVVRELGIVLAVAAATGLIAGGVVSVLTVPPLARAAVDRAYLAGQTELAVDVPGMGILLGVLTAGIAVVVLNLSRRVRVLASTSLPGEAEA